jgi:hypothetical protein
VAAASASGASGIVPRILYQGVRTSGVSTFGSSGGTFQFEIAYSSGTLNFGRNTGNGLTTYDNADGSAFSAGGAPGSLTWATVPSSPGSISASAVGRNVTVNYTGPASNGGATITNYQVQYSKDGGAWTGTTNDVNGNLTFVNLAPGSYRFRVYAQNEVGSSAAIATGTVKVYSGMYVWNGTAYVPALGVYNWNGTAFVLSQGVYNWNGTAFVPAL